MRVLAVEGLLLLAVFTTIVKQHNIRPKTHCYLILFDKSILSIIFESNMGTHTQTNSYQSNQLGSYSYNNDDNDDDDEDDKDNDDEESLLS